MLTWIAAHADPVTTRLIERIRFFSWRGQSQLERVCGDFKASMKGSNSKLEAFNANVRKELLARVEFADLADARQQIARWVYTYNFERVHEGLGGLLVPADRYFGCSQEVLAQLERGAPAVVPGEPSPESRTLELFRVVSRAGSSTTLPAEQVVCLVIGMAIMRDRPVTDVVDKLDLALPSNGRRKPMARSAVAQAWAKLGDWFVCSFVAFNLMSLTQHYSCETSNKCE